jgi:hypothetical protein
MFPITVTIQNQAQLSAVMAALLAEQVEIQKTEKPATKVKEVVADKKAKPEATTATPAPTEKPESITQMTASEAVKALDGHANRPADAPTYQDAATAITKLSRTKGRDTAVAVLAKFGAAKLPDVKPEQFADVIAAANEAMGE